MAPFDCAEYNDFIAYLYRNSLQARGIDNCLSLPRMLFTCQSFGGNAFDLRRRKLMEQLIDRLVKDSMITVHADPAREGRTLYKWETSFFSRANDILKPRNSGSRTGWVHLFLHEVSDTHPSVQNAMEHLELFLNTRSLVDKWSQTPHSTRAQQGSLPAFSASTTPVIDKQQERPFLAASPATPGSSLKRSRSRSDASSSSIICNSSSPARRSTPSSSPQSCQSLVLESSDRSKRLRIDDTIVVETHEKENEGEHRSENLDDTDKGDEDQDHTLLDHILSRLQPIPKLQTISELLQDEMDTISKNYRSQDTHIKSLETNLRTIDARHVLGLDNLHGNYTSQNERVKSLERARETQSDVLSKTEESLAKVEAKLIAVEERVSKEISNMRIDKQSQNLGASGGKSGSYDKIKARCRKIEERLMAFDQRTTAERSLYRLLDSNTKYTRELNDGVNTWKQQCDKEYSEAKLLKEQVQTLEKRSSAMEKMIRDQQGLIEELASQLRFQRTSKISEASIGYF